MDSQLKNFIFNSAVDFRSRATKVFNYQRENNSVYRTFCEVMGLSKNVPEDFDLTGLPLIPIRIFKEAEIKTFKGEEELLFQSSGTSDMERSKHYIFDSDLYKSAIEREFYRIFPKNKTSVLCYTPGYADNPHSSLIWMLNHLVKSDPSGLSRFLTLNQPLHQEETEFITRNNRTVVLFGAAFGLLDLLDNESDPLPESAHIIETGGMKTYRREISKAELRNRLSAGFQIPKNHIHSEYGMCELLSQSYAIGGEWFTPPHWVRVSIRDARNPERICSPGEEGKIGIIDLANLHSCSFILTEDKGVMDEKERFKVLGRWSQTDLRGCNFLIDQEL